MNDGLGIAMRGKTVATRKQIAPQAAIVIDFAVKDYPVRLIFICDRLMAGIQVDDAQAPHPDRAAAIQMKTFIVRAAVADCAAHSLNVR
jgi:hypothetical protein